MKTHPEDMAVLGEAEALMLSLEPEPEHVRQVRRLSSLMWIETSKLHQLP